MGALPGGGLLTDPPPGRASSDGPPPPGHGDGAQLRGAGPFDVEVFRARRRTVVVREVAAPLLVLGSTQPRSVVDEAKAARAGVGVTRRRSGGGAVLLRPAAQVWADVWIPRSDSLWSDDPRVLAARVGESWARSFGGAAEVHRGGPLVAEGSGLVCFAGVGPGEVLVGGRKLVGLAQWRSRQGALVHGCVYRAWEPRALVGLLAIGGEAARRLADSLATSAGGLDSLPVPSTWDGTDLVAALPGPDWDTFFLTARGPAQR